MSVANWFRTFCSNIQISNAASISRRYCSITRRLNIDFSNTQSETSHSLYVGSYGRNTAIDGFSDLDMLFRLPVDIYHQYDNHSGNGQSALLQEVRNSIRKTYPTTHIGADGQVVAIRFNDGITFEVVPCFINTNDSYTYPCANRGGSWKVTNPKPEIEAIRSRDSECNGNLIKLCKMMRSWKRTWDVPMGGLLIDTLAYQFIENWHYRDKSYLYYDFLCRDFFEYMAGQSTTQEFWRSPGSGQYVYKQGNFQYKARRCCNLSNVAIKHETDGQAWSAKQKWREIFGTVFPN